MSYSFVKYISKPIHDNERGFTLIELLVAITMFGVVAAMVYGTLNAVLSKTNIIATASDNFEMAKTCMERMSLDLAGIYVEPFPLYSKPGLTDPPDPYRVESKIEFVGGSRFSTLRFASTEHLKIGNFPDSRLAEIRYYVTSSDDPDQGFVLRRADTAFPYGIDPNAQKSDNDPVLCANITALDFTFFKADGNSEQSWDSDSEMYGLSTPVAVEIHLEIGSENTTRSFYTRVELPVFRLPPSKGNK